MQGVQDASADGGHLVPLVRMLATIDGPGHERQLEGVLGVLAGQLQATPTLAERPFMEIFCSLEGLLARGDTTTSPATARPLAEEVGVAGWDCVLVALRHVPRVSAQGARVIKACDRAVDTGQ